MFDLICPYCSHEQCTADDAPDFWEYQNWECDSCERTFKAESQIIYMTKKMEE